MTFRQFLQLCTLCWQEKGSVKCKCSKNMADWTDSGYGVQSSNHQSIGLPASNQHISISI